MIMKNYYVLFLFLGLSFSSCIKDYSTVTKFVIKNRSDQNIKIQVSHFETVFYATTDTIFFIEADSEINHQYEKDGKDAIYEFPFGGSSDSLIIFYNDIDSTVFTKNNSSQRNPLNIENYSGGKVKDGLYRYTYEVSKQDLQEAIEN